MTQCAIGHPPPSQFSLVAHQQPEEEWTVEQHEAPHGNHGDTFCPVKALANRVNALYLVAPQDPSLPISFVMNASHITAMDITWAVQGSFMSLQGCSTQATAPPASVPTCYVQVVPWHSNSTMVLMVI
jgi:hypothetical protein